MCKRNKLNVQVIFLPLLKLNPNIELLKSKAEYFLGEYAKKETILLPFKAFDVFYQAKVFYEGVLSCLQRLIENKS